MRGPLVALSLFFLVNLNAQDCLLGIGGKDDEVIIQTFKLTEEQQENLKNWGAELKFRNEIYTNRLKNVLRNYPTETLEDIEVRAQKHSDLLDSMEANMRLLDKRLLGLFSVEQYNLYVSLCNQIQRVPIYTNVSQNKN